MPGFVGRNIGFTWNGQPIAGLREKGIARAGEPINVTSDENDGVRELLANVAAESTVDISLSGVTKDEVLALAWHTGQLTGTFVITYPNGTVLSGTAFLASYNDTGPYNDATTFDATLQSSGPVDYEPSTGS